MSLHQWIQKTCNTPRPSLTSCLRSAFVNLSYTRETPKNWLNGNPYLLSSVSPLWNNGRQVSPTYTAGHYHHHLAPADTSCLQIIKKCWPPSLLWLVSTSTISCCPVHCTVSWVFWCHPEDVSCKSKSSLSYDASVQSDSVLLIRYFVLPCDSTSNHLNAWGLLQPMILFVVCLSVCKSVSLSVMCLCPAKTTERLDVLFGMEQWRPQAAQWTVFRFITGSAFPHVLGKVSTQKRTKWQNRTSSYKFDSTIQTRNPNFLFVFHSNHSSLSLNFRARLTDR